MVLSSSMVDPFVLPVYRVE